MSGRLDDLWASLLSVADNGRAVWRRARSSVQDEITAVKFKIQTALMEILWSILGLSRFLLPILKFIALVWAIFFAAIGLYYIIYQRYVPKLMLEEPIHFNFAIDAPSAKLNLLMPNDHSGEILSSLHYGRPLAEKYLRPGSIYEFSLKFTVAKSPRNQNIGKFMSYLTVMDRKDEPVARSARPVVVPYHSDLFLIADQIFKLPLYFLGAEEAETIQILMLRNYKEPYNEAASTKTVEVSISRSDVDILHCTLTIYPELNWFTYSLLNFPYMSFSIGVLICFWGLFFTFMSYGVIILIVKFIAGIVDEDDEDNPEISGGRASTFQLDTPGAGSTPAVSNNGPSWMEDIGFDPLSTVDNSAIISAQVDSIHQVIVDSAELFGTVASDQAVAAMDALRSSIHARIIIIEGEVEAGDDADRYISSNRDNDASSSMSIAEDLQLDSNETSVVSGGLRQRRMSSS